ncbi:asparaginase [Bacillaceae bacterium]
MKKICIIHTGGTIAMSHDPQSGSVKPLHADAIDRLAPMGNGLAEIEIDHFLNVPSPHMTPETMLALSRHLQSRLAEPDVAGAVVTHGTDTLEETAYFLDLTTDSPKTVVVTGAMRSSDELATDGPLNLAQAVRVAADPQSAGRGVLVVFNEQIHAARYVTKAHTSSTSAFASPQRGPIGEILRDKICYYYALEKRETFQALRAAANVPLIKTVAGMRAEWLHFLLEQPVDGLVIEAFGIGNVPPAILPVIEQLLARNIPVVLVSRCYQGAVQDVYGYPGGSRQLREMGVIFGGSLNGQKARIKLIVALSAGKRGDALREVFAL